MNYRAKASILIVLGILAMAPWPNQALAQKRIALVIGNDAYAEVPRLQKAVGDATAIAGVLEGLGYTVIRALDVDRAEMSRKIFEFTAQIEQNDEALFFFAGHGVRHQGRNYLLPVDVPTAREGRADLVVDSGFAADEIGDRIRRQSPRVNVMILDACRDNPFKVAGQTRAAFGGTRGLTRMAAPVGTFIMFSAGEGEQALDRMGDNDTNPNSLFTRNLIREMTVPGRSLLALAKDVQSKVYTAAKQLPHDQAPAFYDRILGDYCLVPGPGGTCGAGTGTATPTPPTDPQQSACRDLLFDQTMQIGTEAALLAFLGSCKAGPQASLAVAALAKLRDNSAGPDQARNHKRIADFVRYDYLAADFADAGYLRRLFAPRVEYFDRGTISADTVIADKVSYASRWTSLNYTLLDDTLDIRPLSDTGDRYRVTFVTRFRASDANRTLGGLSETTLTLGLAGDRTLIEGENSRVIERDAAAIAPPPQAVPSAPTIVHGAGGQPAASFWDHNGSLMYLVAEGDRRWFYYERPRSGMLKAGARPGSLLFEGRKIGGAYQGSAYLFSTTCGNIPYQVSGPIENGARRVVMHGSAPSRDRNCNIARYKQDRLVFDYLSKTRP